MNLWDGNLRSVGRLTPEIIRAACEPVEGLARIEPDQTIDEFLDQQHAQAMLARAILRELGEWQ